MTSSKPYVIRAIYEWITDNELTPYILVDATFADCRIPEEYVTDGRIIFNIAFNVVKNLDIGNDVTEFTARFSGVQIPIYFPTAAVKAIYAKENGEGTSFPDEPISRKAKHQEKKITKGKPNLTIVK